MDSIWLIIALISSHLFMFYLGKISVLNEKMEYFMTVMGKLAEFCKNDDPKN